MIDFKVPRFYEKNKYGSFNWPSEIENWFSEDFDNYFIYHHPIIIDLDIKNGLKPSRDIAGRPKNKLVLTFAQFKAEFFKEGENFKNYSEYVRHQIDFEDTRPNYLWGRPEGSHIHFDDILVLLKVLDSSLQTVVYSHYDDLRKIRGNLENINLPSFYLSKMETIKIIATSFSNLSPEFILEKNKKWCINTLYDDCVTAIACDNETAEKLIEHEDLGIEKIKSIHKSE